MPPGYSRIVVGWGKMYTFPHSSFEGVPDPQLTGNVFLLLFLTSPRLVVGYPRPAPSNSLNCHQIKANCPSEARDAAGQARATLNYHQVTAMRSPGAK